MHCLTKCCTLSVHLTKRERVLCELNPKLRQDFERFPTQRRVRLELIENKPGFQRVVYGLGTFNRFSDTDRRPEIRWRRYNRHECHISYKKRTLRYLGISRGRTINYYVVIILSKLLDLPMNLSVRRSEANDCRRERV